MYLFNKSGVASRVETTPKSTDGALMLGAPTGLDSSHGSYGLAPNNTALSVLFDDASVQVEGACKVASRCFDFMIPVLAAPVGARVKIEWRGFGWSSGGGRCFLALLDGLHLHNSRYHEVATGYGSWVRPVQAGRCIALSVWMICRSAPGDEKAFATVVLDSLDISLMLGSGDDGDDAAS